MLRITPTPQQWAALEEVRLAKQNEIAAEAAKHEEMRTAQARMFKSKRRDGFVSLQNTLIETMHLLVKTEPKVVKAQEAHPSVHLLVPVQEVLATHQNYVES